jgi:hypothetical protein
VDTRLGSRRPGTDRCSPCRGRDLPLAPVSRAGAERRRLRRARIDESLVECLFGAPIVDRDRAAVEYWAILRTPRGEETLAGVTLLRSGPDGRVVEHRDYWSMQAGRTPPRF